ncbi:type V CRISPR-associated protein Cas12k [Geminocystis sp. GBBB08]|uniref:type V CRISPR-associated protein Cas12k n=1 Tax=Geminocystis sp. GBBB08 TaxID=2604140 RepID=UPI0027E2E39E|nr:type V CRISPR-associated protein Cas12k [Geminocystis sp. GBBB08]
MRKIVFPFVLVGWESILFKSPAGRRSLCLRHRRQLPYFQRFYEDQEFKKASKDQLSSALFTLRSAMILWKEDEEKGELWDRHKLYLHCTFETRCLTAEGTSSITQEKQKEVTKMIDLMKAKEELSDSQQVFIRRKNSTLAKLNNTFPRPSKPVYQGKPNVHLESLWD